jgi:hypothetical protein
VRTDPSVDVVLPDPLPLLDPACVSDVVDPAFDPEAVFLPESELVQA